MIFICINIISNIYTSSMTQQIYLFTNHTGSGELLTTSIELTSCDYYEEDEFEFRETFNLLNSKSFSTLTDFDYNYQMSTTEFTFDLISKLTIILRNHTFISCGTFSYDVTNIITIINNERYYIKNMETLKYLIDKTTVDEIINDIYIIDE